MKTIAKLGLAGLAIAASAAHADVFLPSTGNGELTLFVKDDTTGAVYARGLQTRIDAVLPQSTINTPYTGDTALGLVQQISYAINTIGPDANLSGFLNSTDSFSWTIMAGDSVGTNSATPDARRYLTTTQTVFDDSNPNILLNSDLSSGYVQLNTVLNLVNDNIDGTGGTLGDGHSTPINGQWRQTGAIPGNISGNWFGSGPDTVNALGTAAHLYVFTSSHVGATGGNGDTVRTYQGVDVILNTDGSLAAVVPPSEVPLPAAAWMLVSGVLTFAGVGRRRNQAAQA